MEKLSVARAVGIISIIITALSGLAEAVRINDLSVPESVQLGQEDVVLNCDYDYDEREKRQLEVKWYFQEEDTPFFQWLPAKGGRPQIIGDKFRGHLNLSYVASPDQYKRHSSLLLRRPTLDLAGRYTCKVSTFLDEDVRHKNLIIYSPASFVSFDQRRALSGDEVNVSCSVHGVFPMPKVRLTWGSYQLDDSEASVSRASSPSGAYAVVVHRMVHHADLPSRETLFGCELSIPGVPEEEYRVREEAVYIHRGHRGRPWQENKSRRESRRHSSSYSSATSLTTTTLFHFWTSILVTSTWLICSKWNI